VCRYLGNPVDCTRCWDVRGTRTRSFAPFAAATVSKRALPSVRQRSSGLRNLTRSLLFNKKRPGYTLVPPTAGRAAPTRAVDFLMLAGRLGDFFKSFKRQTRLTPQLG
jgi:hypothetical protein